MPAAANPWARSRQASHAATGPVAPEVAGPRRCEGRVEFAAEAHDLLLGPVDQRRADGDRVTLDAAPLAGGGHPPERLDELGPAVRIAGVVDGVDPDPHGVEVPGLGHTQGHRQEDAVAGGDVGDRDAVGRPRRSARRSNRR